MCAMSNSSDQQVKKEPDFIAAKADFGGLENSSKIVEKKVDSRAGF